MVYVYLSDTKMTKEQQDKVIGVIRSLWNK